MDTDYLRSKQLAKKIRLSCLEMTSRGKSSHIGACLSVADILAVLYSSVLIKDVDNPTWDERDRVVMSKGHAGAALYAALAHSGYFSVEILQTHYQNGSNLSGHVSHKGIPGVEISTGSLGHGLSIASGIALGMKLGKRKCRTYAILSDGECDEGSTWEAILFAGHHKLSNLIAIVDYNKIQSLGNTKDVLNLEPFHDKWSSFGWHVIQADGHDHQNLLDIFQNLPTDITMPTCILCHTTKGKGVSFMENQILWHYRTAAGEEYENAYKELISAE